VGNCGRDDAELYNASFCSVTTVLGARAKNAKLMFSSNLKPGQTRIDAKSMRFTAGSDLHKSIGLYAPRRLNGA
jgi:hypothetical protein